MTTLDSGFGLFAVTDRENSTLSVYEDTKYWALYVKRREAGVILASDLLYSTPENQQSLDIWVCKIWSHEENTPRKKSQEWC